jgi:hypothetical protein
MTWRKLSIGSARFATAGAEPHDMPQGPMGLQRSASVPTVLRPKEAVHHRRAHSEPLPQAPTSRWGSLRRLGSLKSGPFGALLRGCHGASQVASAPPRAVVVSGVLPPPSWTGSEEGRRGHLAAFKLNAVADSYRLGRESLEQEVQRELDRREGKAPTTAAPLSPRISSPDDMTRRKLEIMLKGTCTPGSLRKVLRSFVAEAGIKDPAEARERLNLIVGTLGETIRPSVPGNAHHDLYMQLQLRLRQAAHATSRGADAAQRLQWALAEPPPADGRGPHLPENRGGRQPVHETHPVLREAAPVRASVPPREDAPKLPRLSLGPVWRFSRVVEALGTKEKRSHP